MTYPIAYKILGHRRRPIHGSGRWPYRQWRSVEGELRPRENGLHLCTRDQLLGWLVRSWLVPEIWEAEYDPDAGVVEHWDKLVVRRARLRRRLRWGRRQAILFGADCAERVLPLYEQQYPGDPRPRRAIEVARGCESGSDRIAAAAEAAGAAHAAYASDAAAAWAAEAAAGAALAARALRAARAAYAAVLEDHAARAAAERAWQTERLFDYLEGRVG